MGGEKMKTPREILLEQHQTAAPELDALRKKIIQSQFRRRNFGSIVLECPSLLWRELVWPCRGIWASLAMAWLLIFVANATMSDAPHPVMAKAAPSREIIMAWQQQQRWLTEFIGPDDTSTALPTRPFSPRPSSQRSFKQFLT